MNAKLLSCGILLLVIPLAAFAQESAVGSRIVGYLPDYRVADIDPEIGAWLTDVVFFSVEPQPGKPLQHPQWKAAQLLLSKWKRDHGVRVTITLGGWNRSAGFPQIAATADSRRDFATAVTKLCDESELDGVDLDWEHPHNAREEADYAALIIELKRALQPKRRTVTAAVAGWQNLPAEGWQALDAVHLMAYDGPGRHSTYDSAVADVQRLIKNGLPANRIRLGVPFYGRGVTERDKTLTYAQIMDRFAPAPAINEVEGVYFNGIELMLRKQKYVADNQLDGIMIWEIGQDARGDRSLLKRIHEATVK